MKQTSVNAGIMDIDENGDVYIMVDKRDFKRIMKYRPCVYGATYEHNMQQAVVTKYGLTATYEAGCAADLFDDNTIEQHVENYEHLS